MENMIETFLNGNLKEAKQSAKRHRLDSIVEYLVDIGWSYPKAFKAAKFLKGVGTFQAYCDAQ